ncbi:splicing factor 45 [Homalodisca vitripennis]|uniref:splicing factor 45 n=1 Tax=Homalodisca vitripennis TaxID=197043 RepID=UPI001EEB8C88|nr:splicing factor 45 [Homalodisca vitripennis]XP_046661204.1 splicing factor 45 [Homalodisca vitripennis]
MSLYDDFDAIKQKSDHVAGWSSGIKLFQSQLQLKKASQTQPRREALRKANNVLAPVIDLKSKKEDDDSNSNSSFGSYSKDARGLTFSPHQNNVTGSFQDMDWNFDGVEYDPMWPNDYEKVVKDLREIREREKEREDEERRKRREDRARPRESRFEPGGPPEERPRKPMIPNVPTGFAGTARHDSEEEEEETERERPRAGGVAIAPPPSLQEPSPSPPVDTLRTPAACGASVAAKIMAKYGFKEGQGLGKKEQGISMALQVEKTSKRGGRIIHEKEMMPPPPPAVNTPPHRDGAQPEARDEPSITEIMRSPSKVVLLRNMVGPGEVDQDLEPEVKDECNTKYGEVIKVVIYELPNAPSDEAVRIFVEFKRIESAIKAVVDLNGRFFGGRQVKAGFYVWEKFNNLELLD